MGLKIPRRKPCGFDSRLAYHIIKRNVMSEWIIKVEKLIHTPKMRGLCQLPYENHPKGCPNFGKSDRCPPKAPYITEFFDIGKPLYLVYADFDFEAHKARMKSLHPDWSERQCGCVLYWQSGVRKILRSRIKKAYDILGVDRHTECAEAMGVNFYATCRLVGLELDRIRDMKIDHHIALMGYRRGLK